MFGLKKRPSYLLVPCVVEGVLNGVGRVAGLLTAGAPLASGVARATGHPELGRSRLLLRESGDQQEHGCSTKRPGGGKERGGGGGEQHAVRPQPSDTGRSKDIHYKSILYVAYAGKEITPPTTRGRAGLGELEGDVVEREGERELL